MNFFKKGLVASAIVASFGASAATVQPSTSALKLSAEGVAAGVAAYNGAFDFDVTIGAEHPAGATVTLTFSNAVDLVNVAANNAVDNTTPQQGDAGDIDFNYGNGSFTFNNVVVTDNDNSKGGMDTITFDISLGQPLAKNAAFNVAIVNGEVSGAATADYSASHAGSVIDTGTGTIAAEYTQFAVSVKTPLDAVINRTTNTIYTDNTANDTFALSIVNYDDLDMSITVDAGANAAYDAVLTGTFTGVTSGEVNVPATSAAATVNGGADFITFDIDGGATPTTNGSADVYSVIFEHGVSAIAATGAVELDFIVNSNDFGAAALNKKQIVTDADAGQWKIDATIINVPYLPVGFEGTSSSVHLSNEKTTAVDVIVSAIDQAGNVYPAVDLGMDLPKQTVTKITQGALMTLLGAPAESKLSVTFNIDANEGDVNGYAFTTDSTGRTEISTSQQRGN
ncbi:hypothetical protein [Thalassotalea sp. SU-HH00458]|uniref:hypothetical protein n=1 Tax=Thalassotalea sp. SU-HH00458 TaxID=3127657 RepID=UPI0031037DAC